MSSGTRRALRPPVLGQLRSGGHAVIEASAGTGKTFTLENLVIDLVLRERIPLEQILVVTFTEKAAEELSVRLRTKLRCLLEAPDAAPESGDSWSIDGPAAARLAEALVGFDRATIATIHAFCQRVLVEHAFEHRRPFNQILVDGRSAFERAFFDVLRTDLARDPDPRPWLEAWLEEASLDRLLDLAWQASARGGRLAPRFDPRRLQRALDELGRAPTHWRAVRPMLVRGGVRGEHLRRAGERLAELTSLVQAAGRDGAPGLLRGLDAGDNPVVEQLLSALRPASDRQAGLRHLVEALDLLRASAAPFASAVLQVILPRVERRLVQQKTRRGEVDFSDMLRLVDESLSSPDGASLVQALRDRYRVALIDEFQDTDPVQWSVFRRLYLEPPAPGRLVVIGDPKQAIYGFRGADVATYLEARDELERAGGHRVVLTESFRATPPLVQALNHLLDQDAPVPFFPGAIDYANPVRAGRDDDAALLEGERIGPPAVLLQPALEDAPPGLRGAEAATAAVIGQEIEQLLDPGRTRLRTATGEVRPLRAREIFVLTRSAREGRAIAERLGRRGIPAALYKQEGLFQSVEAHDVRTLLAAIADPHRRGLALRAWRTPFFGVPIASLAGCLDLRASDPLMARLLEWKGLAEARDYPRLFASVLEHSGVTERLVFAAGGDRAHTNYLHLFEILQAEASAGRPPLGELVQRFSAFMQGRARPIGDEGNVERLESERDAVQVMTMHKSKGLEAEVVFLFGGLSDVPGEVHPFHDAGERQLFVGTHPPERARSEAEEEIRRLLYVAVTRARTRIYIPYFGTGADGAPAVDRLGGLQAVLEPHLADLAGQPDRGWAVRRVSPPPPRGPLAPQIEARIAAWTPPAELLDRPSPALPFETLRAARLGPVVTSYSRMKSELGAGGGRAGNWSLELVEDRMQELARTEVAEPRPPDHLPPGAASGRFLHEVLERIELETAGSIADPQAWAARPEVEGLLDEALERHRRRTFHRGHGARLVHAAVTTPLGLGALAPLEAGLVGADRVVREMEFLFPIPRDPSQGFVKGFIDVVFEHEGRTFVLDWKSDDLASYAPPVVDRHVRDNYLLQAEIYAIAAVRLVGIASEAEYEARYGGALYVFLRGLEAGDPRAGQWFVRPSWTELLEAAARLEARPQPTRTGVDDRRDPAEVGP